MSLPEELLFRRRNCLPVVLSAEAAECGLACMTMVSRFHGHDVDLNGLRQRFPASLAGSSLRALCLIAAGLGFSARPLRVEMTALQKVKLPAILHWNLNHFVVLRSISRQGLVIHDPAVGAVRMSVAEASKCFTGVVLELAPVSGFKPITARVPVKLSSLWTRLSGGGQSLGVILGLSLALQVLTFALPLQMQLVIDNAILNNDLEFLAVIGLAFAAIVLLQTVTQALRDWSLQLIGNQVVFQMVGNVVRHLMRLPTEYFEKRHVGDILSRVGATRQIQDALTNGLIAALIDGAMAAAALVVLFLYAPTLGFIVAGSVLIVVALNSAAFPAIQRRTDETIKAAANEQSHMMETLRAATTIRLMGHEGEREGAWRNLYSRQFNSAVSLSRYQILLSSGQSAVMGLQTVLVIYLGARMVLEAGGLSVGMLVAFLSFRQTFSDRAIALVARTFQFFALSLYLNRLGDILAQEPLDDTHAQPAINWKGGIALKNVSFRYGEADEWVLRNVSIDIAPRECVAIVGQSGSGKSTLLKLMLGLQDPTEGEIYLDGKRASRDTWGAWRRSVGVVTQDDRLLSGTLADNIAFFDLDLDLNRVHMAAIAAQIHLEIEAMPLNYMTLVGDMGSSLSAGQRQRILLARALYRRPKILVLDEGTANLDADNEEAIAHLISQLPITRVIVSHRPRLVEAASRLFVLEDGRLGERPDVTAALTS